MVEESKEIIYEGRVNASLRLKELKEHKFLTKRIFQKISENMHYEIFKNMNSTDLIHIRGISLGGYQLTSNPLLRNRIKNYFKFIEPDILEINEELLDKYKQAERILLIFEQTGKNELKFQGIKIKDNGLIQLTRVFEIIPQIKELNLS